MNLHMICNAHIDPVWQWEWEEGAAAAVSTFRCAADFCEENDDFIFCHNEALLYRWVEEYEPELFERIRRLVSAGKWHIMGGWHLQPDCNMPCGESFVRQILEGRKYFLEKFGAAPTTAINFDPFGHTRGLVQILAKSGYDSYMFCRPGQDVCKLPSDAFEWVGFDGSTVMGRRVSDSYNSSLGHAADKIGDAAKRDSGEPFSVVLWGVGDHGGGASREDIRAIAALKSELEKTGIRAFHSTPEAYFAELKKKGGLPRHKGDINPWAVGCYTSQIRIKQKNRLLEGTLFSTERMCTHAAQDGMEYPEDELSAAEYDLLTAQFHDSLPGSSIQPVEDMALRQLDHGLETLSRVRARAFYRLAAGQRKAEADEIPILVYNPYPYPVEGDFACEFILWDQNRKIEFSNPSVYRDGKYVPSQCEKERSNIPIDWRKRVVFHTALEPMQMNRFDCKIKILPEKPKPTLPVKGDFYVFDGGGLHAEISRRTGLISSLTYDGKPYLTDGAFTLEVMRDNADPWGMTVNGWKEKIGEFSLLSEEESTKFANVEAPLESVRVIEDGDVRTTVQAVFGYGSCRAVYDYHFSKITGQLGLDVRVIWDEKSKNVKLRVPTSLMSPEFLGETAYGEQVLKTNGDENVSQRYIVIHDEESAVSVINDGIYGSSVDGDALRLTLLRSPGYTAHPVDDRQIMPQDRYMPYVEQGERLYHFCFIFGETHEVRESTPRAASAFNEQPMAISFFPAGGGKKPEVGITLEGDRTVLMPTCKRSLDGRSTVIRLFHAGEGNASAVVRAGALTHEVKLGTYEIKTLRLTDG
ncbi:MAG: alpha-mannosidase, partial [Clostridia bacterium]|nr:alpha-mannosidase [Clostridia bacterium]